METASCVRKLRQNFLIKSQVTRYSSAARVINRLSQHGRPLPPLRIYTRLHYNINIARNSRAMHFTSLIMTRFRARCAQLNFETVLRLLFTYKHIEIDKIQWLVNALLYSCRIRICSMR